ncbi:DUF4386 domain-containing protein [Methanococcoides orientis]|uniref:DUF4386 domain-containing protein n=1 Tax=Methanococcoides orientis TaxID=2822137 RepID=UPI001E2DF0E2|nr:DUF4386 domain-containing protein [Methanococcoides orientis]UGV41376.1 DUF4386 domain-containing protein [Methanococcoides orientis]
MINRIADISQRKAARVAGLLYLMIFVFGIFAEAFVRQSLIVPGDAATTVNNIMASESLFRLGFVSDLIMITSFLLLPMALYVVLNVINKNHALLMVIFALISVPIMFVNMILHYAPLLLLSGADYLTVFEADQLHALVMFFFDLYTAGVWIATIFHGLWLLPFGYLVYKSGYIPRILGVLLIIGCFGYMIESFTFFLLPPSYVVITYPGLAVATIAELSITFWLLLKGGKIPEMES